MEVTRLRAAAAAPDEAAARRDRIARAVCAKLPQMPPSAINVLTLVAAPGGYEAGDLIDALRALTETAARRDDAFFVRRGFLGARDFGRQLQRVSAILLRPSPPDDAEPGALWPNPQAKHALPPDIARILARSRRGSDAGEAPASMAARRRRPIEPFPARVAGGGVTRCTNTMVRIRPYMGLIAMPPPGRRYERKPR